MQGHWSATQEQVAQDNVGDEMPLKLNLGIAVVVPAEVVLHQVLDPAMKQFAEARGKILDEQDEAGPD